MLSTSPRDIVALIFHAVFSIHHISLILYSSIPKDLSHVTDERVEIYTEKMAPFYYTSWNVIMQAIYFTMALLYDILHISKKQPNLENKLKIYKGYLYTSLVFPSTVFVCGVFWGAYNINREWMLPRFLDEFVPGWLNHCTHTNIAIFLVVEVFIANQILTTYKTAFVSLTTISVIYYTIFLTIFVTTGIWVYPVFYDLWWSGRIGFMTFNYLYGVVGLNIGIKIENFKQRALSSQYEKLNKD